MKKPLVGWVVTALLFLTLPTAVLTAEPTTSVRIIKYGTDGAILDETHVTYQWMEGNLPVHGDGVTHYYHQGPVFEGDKWDRNESKNFKDKGAVKGTNIRDLCDLVGGMSPGDEVMVHAQDGYYVIFDYTSVYEPSSRQGNLILCWYCGGDPKMGGYEGKSYPPDYFVGMRLVFFADDHVFGNWDMHECLNEKAQYFYGELYPSTNGLSIKWCNEIGIYTSGYTGEHGDPAKSMPPSTTTTSRQIHWFATIFLIAGLLLVVYALKRGRK